MVRGHDRRMANECEKNRTHMLNDAIYSLQNTLSDYFVPYRSVKLTKLVIITLAADYIDLLEKTITSNKEQEMLLEKKKEKQGL